MFEPETQLVTVATFHSEMEFLLARTRLESCEIECFSPDENSFRIGGWHSHWSGLQLQVRDRDAGEAAAILRHTAPLEDC